MNLSIGQIAAIGIILFLLLIIAPRDPLVVVTRNIYTPVTVDVTLLPRGDN